MAQFLQPRVVGVRWPGGARRRRIERTTEQNWNKIKHHKTYLGLTIVLGEAINERVFRETIFNKYS